MAPGARHKRQRARRVGLATYGAALGGVIGSFSGNAGWGALLGAGAGAGAGYLYDQSQQAQARAYYQGRADARRAARYRGGPDY